MNQHKIDAVRGGPLTGCIMMRLKETCNRHLRKRLADNGTPRISYLSMVFKPPVPHHCLGITAFRRRTAYKETCPQGAGIAELYP